MMPERVLPIATSTATPVWGGVFPDPAVEIRLATDRRTLRWML